MKTTTTKLLASLAAVTATTSIGTAAASTTDYQYTPVASALRDALASTSDAAATTDGGHRHLASSDLCMKESKILALCVPASEALDCSACMMDAYKNSLPTTAANPHPGCHEMDAYTCAPARDCPCLSTCMDEYNAVANCMSDAILTALVGESSPSCNLTCGGESQTTNSSTDNDNERFAPVGEVGTTSGLRTKKAVP